MHGLPAGRARVAGGLPACHHPACTSSYRRITTLHGTQPTFTHPITEPLLQARQFVESRRGELADLQRSILGLDDIAAQEGLNPSEQEIEVRAHGRACSLGRAGLRPVAWGRAAACCVQRLLQHSAGARAPPLTSQPLTPPTHTLRRPSLAPPPPTSSATARSMTPSGCASRCGAGAVPGRCGWSRRLLARGCPLQPPPAASLR